MTEENKNTEPQQPAEGKEQFMADGSSFMEIPADEGSAADEQPQTTNIKPQTEADMEVHHHTHADHGKKTWRSYFWEFLMLFLAVFCGFLAEYQLEHVIENQREKTLMRSLVEDLKTDNTQLQTYLEWRAGTNQDFDSLLILLPEPGVGRNVYLTYRLANRSVLRFGLPDISERTIQQLKNAGGLRLIRSIAVSDAINKHYMSVNRLKANYETERLLRLQLVKSRSDIFDATLFLNNNTVPEAYRLFSQDPITINRFMNDVLAAKQVNRGLIYQLDSARISSTLLKELIEKEYDFK